MRKRERARAHFDTLFNLFLQKGRKISPCPSAGGRGTKGREIIGFFGGVEVGGGRKQEKSVFFSLSLPLSLSKLKKNPTKTKRTNLAHGQLLDLLLDKAVLGRDVRQSPRPKHGVSGEDRGAHPGRDRGIVGVPVAEAVLRFFLFSCGSVRRKARET